MRKVLFPLLAPPFSSYDFDVQLQIESMTAWWRENRAHRVLTCTALMPIHFRKDCAIVRPFEWFSSVARGPPEIHLDLDYERLAIDRHVRFAPADEAHSI
ncbi:Uncharacterized protein APZ42_023665 [Daphnia magna]|uniref:Uncharacterized protein n=1 Tax=Daphnia magna TaxID=35525 RepID=A0A164UVA5_9CRUS|nr:Uncharacterized protein APZ42_023665 [Daphnia magna]